MMMIARAAAAVGVITAAIQPAGAPCVNPTASWRVGKTCARTVDDVCVPVRNEEVLGRTL
jgi:hypothetical protein